MRKWYPRRVPPYNLFGKLVATVWNLPFKLRHHYLAWRYKGVRNIPQKEDDYHYVTGLPELVIIIDTLVEVLVKLGIEPDTSHLYRQIHHRIVAESDSPLMSELEDLLYHILNRRPMRKAIYSLLLEIGDIHIESVRFLYPGDSREEFEHWLEEK